MAKEPRKLPDLYESLQMNHRFIKMLFEHIMNNKYILDSEEQEQMLIDIVKKLEKDYKRIKK